MGTVRVLRKGMLDLWGSQTHRPDLVETGEYYRQAKRYFSW